MASELEVGGLTVSGSGHDAATISVTNAGSNNARLLLNSGHGNWSVCNSDTIGDALEFRDETENATRLAINSSGNVGVGNSAPSAPLEVSSSAASTSSVISTFSTTDSEHSVLALKKSSSATVGTKAVTADGEILGRIDAYGVDTNSNQRRGAQIEFNQAAAATGSKVAGNIVFKTSSTSANDVEAMRISSTGLATFSGGIAFQSATTGSGTGTGYTLDKYEEGTWTPEIADATTGGNTGSASTAKGYYTRVGNAVTVNGLTTNVDTTGMTSTSAVVIRGLPFQSGSASGTLNELGRAVGSCVLDKVDFDSYTRNVNPQVHAGHSYFYFHQTRDTKSDTFILVSNLTSGEADLHFSFTYFV